MGRDGPQAALRPLLTGLAASLVVAAAGCRPNPDCYTSSECDEDEMCAAGSCVTPDAGAVGTLEPTWHEVIFPIVQQRCWGGGNCHVRPLNFGVPMALELYADTQQPSRQTTLIFEEMTVRVQDVTNPMPPRGQTALTPQEIRFFVRWDQLGAPIGDPTRAPDAGTNFGTLDAGVVNSGPLALVGSEVEVTTGFFSLHGPAWGNASNLLVMSDRGQDSVFFIDQTAVPQVLLRPSSEAVGLGSDVSGNLVMTQYQSRQVSLAQGTTLTPLTQDYMGSRYNGPHDVVSRADGNLYFTDPDFGLGARTREIGFNGIFRLARDGSPPVAEWQGALTTAPAGLELDPAENKLYVTDRVGGFIRRFDVGANGALSMETRFASTYPSPDGITVDIDGNVYVATEFGVQAFSPEGLPFGLLALPGAATGVTFGGSDLQTLYVTTRTTLFSFRMPIAGVPR